MNHGGTGGGGRGTAGVNIAKTSRKVFVQRDYSTGTRVKFSLDFPQELIGIVGLRRVAPISPSDDDCVYCVHFVMNVI